MKRTEKDVAMDRVAFKLRRAMADAARHKRLAEKAEKARGSEVYILDHWQWANHYTREAVQLANELKALRDGAEKEDIR